MDEIHFEYPKGTISKFNPENINSFQSAGYTELIFWTITSGQNIERTQRIIKKYGLENYFQFIRFKDQAMAKPNFFKKLTKNLFRWKPRPLF